MSANERSVSHQVTQDHLDRHWPRVQLAEVAGGAEARGKRHLEVALEAEQGGHHDDHPDLGEDRPVLDRVQDDPGPRHAQSRQDERRENLKIIIFDFSYFTRVWQAENINEGKYCEA